MTEDNTDNHISQIVEEMDPGAMMTKYVVIAEGIDKEGERAIYTVTQDNAMIWDTMGLLHYALLMEKQKIIEEDELE